MNPLAETKRSAAHGGRHAIVAAMILSIVGVGVVAWWDGEREAAAALEDFGAEQAVVADSVAVGFATRLERIAVSNATSEPLNAMRDVAKIERPGELVLLSRKVGDAPFTTADGRSLRSDVLSAAFATTSSYARVTRDQTSALGLVPRMAIAGLARLDAGPRGRWEIAVVTSAARERDRAARTRTRLVSSVVVAAALVLAFGGLALRRQRRELALQGALRLAEIERASDERLERAARLAMMGTMASGVAHEIGTPLGIIAGRAEQLMPLFRDDERGARKVAIILEQTARIDGVIRAFLDLARGGAPNLARVEPIDVARAAMRMVEHRFEKANVSLTLKTAAGIAAIHGDVRLLEHAISNLLLNACEACAPNGHVELATESDTERVSFVVTDDGAGISDVDAARAHEPFFTTKPIGQGTGLGLAITHEIIKSHRGTFVIERRRDGIAGTRASLALPTAVVIPAVHA